MGRFKMVQRAVFADPSGQELGIMCAQVRFVRSYSPYNPGDVAAFGELEAEKLCKIGAAMPVPPGEDQQPTTESESQPITESGPSTPPVDSEGEPAFDPFATPKGKRSHR